MKENIRYGHGLISKKKKKTENPFDLGSEKLLGKFISEFEGLFSCGCLIFGSPIYDK